MNSKMLDVRNLSINFGGVKAVDKVNFQIHENSITSLIGPNGAGKTTIFNLISGIYKPTEGSALLNGREIVGLKQHEISKLGIARTFQNIRLYSGLSVSENVQAVLDARADYHFFQAVVKTPKARRIDKENKILSEEYLDIVGLLKYRNDKPASLPYGMQRKLELARALASKPCLLLLDEPAAGLNSAEVEDFIGLIHEIRSKLNLTILLIEHRLKVVYSLSEKVYVLNFGEMIASGTPEEIRTNEDVIKAYIGEDE